MIRLSLILSLCAFEVAAESVFATRAIRPNTIITADLVHLDAASVDGSYSDLDDVVGKEARVALYPGRAIPLGALGEPAVVARNQVVELTFAQGGLRIVTEGRALGRGAAGERIRVMNMASKSVLFGTIQPDGSVLVSN